MDRLEDLVQQRHPEDFAALLPPSGRGAFRRMVVSPAPTLRFFFTTNGQERVRLACNLDHAVRDAAEAEHRAEEREHILGSLRSFLDPGWVPPAPGGPQPGRMGGAPWMSSSGPTRTSRTDGVSRGGPEVPRSPNAEGIRYPLPMRGDLVRLLRRRAPWLHYEPLGNMICLNSRVPSTSGL